MKRILMLTAVCLIAVAVASAQQMHMPTPGPEVKKLSYLEDTWTLTGDMKPNSFGPGGKKMDERFSIKEVSPTGYTFKFEMAPSGQQLATVMEGMATKQ